jgi:hypothetical protein
MDIREITPEERRELQDFDRRFRSELVDNIEKIDDLPDDLRIDTWGELSERFRQYQKAITEREGTQPDFDDPAIKEKHAGLVKSLHLDADQIVRKALQTRHANDLSSGLKARAHGAVREHDRER